MDAKLVELLIEEYDNDLKSIEIEKANDKIGVKKYNKLYKQLHDKRRSLLENYFNKKTTAQPYRILARMPLIKKEISVDIIEPEINTDKIIIGDSVEPVLLDDTLEANDFTTGDNLSIEERNKIKKEMLVEMRTDYINWKIQKHKQGTTPL